MSKPPEHVPRDLRGVGTLSRHRGRHPVVIVCREDAERWAQHRDELHELDAELVLEPTAGSISRELGRPMVAVCNRYLDVTLAAPDLSYDTEVRVELAHLGVRCEECPQASEEPGGEAWAL